MEFIIIRVPLHRNKRGITNVNKNNMNQNLSK